jgi:hypothetical protein
MSKFWLQFIITEAVGVAQAFVGISSINPALKTALENLISAGQSVIAAL